MSETPKDHAPGLASAITPDAAEIEADADADADAERESSAPVSKSRRFIIYAIVAIVLIAGAAIGLTVSRAQWLPAASPYLQQFGVEMPAFLRPNAGPPTATKPGTEGNPFTALVKRVDTLAKAVAALQQTKPAAVDPALNGRLAALEKALPTFADDLKTLEASVNAQIIAVKKRLEARDKQPKAAANGALGTPPATAAGGDIQNLLTDLTTRLAQLEGQPQNTVRPQLQALAAENQNLRALMQKQATQTATRLANLTATMEAQMAALRGKENSAGKRLLAANLLARATATNAPFEAELAAITADDLTSEDRAVLSTHAATGVTSKTALTRQFRDLAPVLIRAAQVGQDIGFSGRILNRLAEVVEVRRVDGKGDDIDAKIARAEQALADGALAAAITALADLPSDAAVVAEPWIIDARSRAAVDRIVADLQARAVQAAVPTNKTGG